MEAGGGGTGWRVGGAMSRPALGGGGEQIQPLGQIQAPDPRPGGRDLAAQICAIDVAGADPSSPYG